MQFKKVQISQCSILEEKYRQADFQETLLIVVWCLIFLAEKIAVFLKGIDQR